MQRAEFDTVASWDHHLPSGSAKEFVRAYVDVRSRLRDHPQSAFDALFFRLSDEPVMIEGEQVDDRCVAVLSGYAPKLVSTFNQVHFWLVTLFRGSLTRLIGIDAWQHSVPFKSLEHIPWVHQLTRELLHAGSVAQRKLISDQAFSIAGARLLDETLVEPALYHIQQARGVMSVDELVERTGTHRRKLERAFAARLGGSPNLELRMRRFEHTLRQFLDDPKTRWRDLEFAPYFDQPHFLKEARYFLRRSPRALVLSERNMKYLFFPPNCFDPCLATEVPEKIAQWRIHIENRTDYLRLLADQVC
jgi:AraC-like DNA-binding protein